MWQYSEKASGRTPFKRKRKIQVRKALYLRSPFLWDVTLRHWVIGARRFETACSHHQGSKCQMHSGAGGCVNTQSQVNRWLAEKLSSSDTAPSSRWDTTSTTLSRMPNNWHFYRCLAFRCLIIRNTLSRSYVPPKIRSVNQSRALVLSSSWSADVFSLFYSLTFALLLGIARKNNLVVKMRCWCARILSQITEQWNALALLDFL